MTTHQVSYSKLADDNLTLPKPQELRDELTAIENLKHGDSIVLEGGRLLGYYSDQLSAFFEDGHGWLSESAAQSIVNGSQPNLICLQKQFSVVSPRYRGYSERRLVTISGEVITQLLVKQFGSPAWINIPLHSHIIHADDYKPAELAA